MAERCNTLSICHFYLFLPSRRTESRNIASLYVSACMFYINKNNNLHVDGFIDFCIDFVRCIRSNIQSDWHIPYV